MKKIYLLAIVSVLLTACNSETPNVNAYDEKTKPIAEEYGLEEFAFSFLINKEEPWIPNEMRVAVIDQENFKDLQIVARHNHSKGTDADYFTIHIRGFKGKGVYKISGKDFKMAWSLNFNNEELVNDETCVLDITAYDEDAGLISGQFSGSIYSPHRSKTTNKLTYNIGSGVINNLQIDHNEDILLNAKNPAK